MKRIRKYLIYVACAAAVAYAVGVFWHVGGRLDLGIDCLLTNEGSVNPLLPGVEIRRIDLDAGDVVGPRPDLGDTIVRLADQSVPTFLHFKRRVASINRRNAEPESPGATVRSPVELLTTAGLPPVVEIGESRWARIEFFRNDQTEGRERPTVVQSWLRLKPVGVGMLAPSVTWFVLEMIILGIGALVVWRRPGDPSAVMFFILSGAYVVTFVGLFHWPSLVGTKRLVYPFVLCALLLPAMTLHFYLLFPRPVKPIRRHLWLTLSLVYVIPMTWAATTFATLFDINALYEAGAPIAEQAAALAKLVWLSYGYLAIAMLLFLVGFGVLIHSFLYGRTRAQKNQIVWILGAVLLSALPVGYLVWAAVWDRAEFVYGSTPKLMVYLISVLYAVAYAVSITRHKLLQVGRLMNRGILYVGISLAGTALYCLLVGIGTALVGRYYLRWENALAAGLTAMLVVVLLVLVRDRFQKALDRRFIRDKYRLDTAMRRLSRVVDRLVDPVQLARQLLSSAHDAVAARRGAVYLRDKGDQAFSLACRLGWPLAPERFTEDSPIVTELGGGLVLTARHGLAVLPTAGQQQLRDWEAELGLAVELDGAVLGVLILGPKEDDKPYTAEDCNFLTALARTTALALNSARGHRTIEALQGKLEATLAKIAEQQQRITFLQSELLGHAAETRGGRRTDGRTKAPSSVPPLRHDIRGSSRVVKEMLSQVGKIAGTSSSVLIRGESGTGKELLARAIHNNSPRAAAGRFVAVHCAALSASLLESELFGHTKGAFTGAQSDRAGRFELADGGTLFLDEIGDIGVETQVKLLRVLQEKAFERVGGHETIRTDVRLISATHRDLEELIGSGEFREDLFYRLNVISLWAPPLRERREDIFELALHFLRVHAEQVDKAIVRIDEEAMDTLASYDWPGNIRQLENALERAVVLADGDCITRAELPPEIVGNLRQRKTGRRRQTTAVSGGADRGFATRAEQGTSLSGEAEIPERQRLADALAQTSGNKAKAARLLGMPRSTFFSKLRKLGLD